MSDHKSTYDLRRSRLRLWMDQRKLNQSDVARRTGKTRSYISLLLSAGKPFGESIAREIESSMHMPGGYLDIDDRESGLEPIKLWNTPEELPAGAYAFVPRISISLSAGGGDVVSEELELPPLAFREDWLRKKQVSHRSNLRVCDIKGDSMYPLLMDGDTVLIDMGQKTVADNEVYAIRYGDEVRIKRLAKRFDGGIIIRSDNPRFPEESLSPEQAQLVSVLGRMLWRGG